MEQPVTPPPTMTTSAVRAGRELGRLRRAGRAIAASMACSLRGRCLAACVLTLLPAPRARKPQLDRRGAGRRSSPAPGARGDPAATAGMRATLGPPPTAEAAFHPRSRAPRSWSRPRAAPARGGACASVVGAARARSRSPARTAARYRPSHGPGAVGSARVRCSKASTRSVGELRTRPSSRRVTASRRRPAATSPVTKFSAGRDSQGRAPGPARSGGRPRRAGRAARAGARCSCGARSVPGRVRAPARSGRAPPVSAVPHPASQLAKFTWQRTHDGDTGHGVRPEADQSHARPEPGAS